MDCLAWGRSGGRQGLARLTAWLPSCESVCGRGCEVHVRLCLGHKTQEGRPLCRVACCFSMMPSSESEERHACCRSRIKPFDTADLLPCPRYYAVQTVCMHVEMLLVDAAAPRTTSLCCLRVERTPSLPSLLPPGFVSNVMIPFPLPTHTQPRHEQQRQHQ